MSVSAAEAFQLGWKQAATSLLLQTLRMSLSDMTVY